ncbi:hypothetical protein GE107_11815 [Cohnella sp. CFH 77786]|uniref:hypothetical protein n=1 Tax=Cohnella sp. CFH 77786 TaxID=2662265 RepID=UPI001C60E746|nr:hypothetical protein [Cohnella sp. CFH 77786]MBW5446748.1 hypothetical protein [Cohnella sp. CFH 77786]
MTDDKIAVLRDIEGFCYSVCRYLLNDEKSAAMAAQAALGVLYRDERFWRLKDMERESIACRTAAVKALEWSRLGELRK